MKDTNKENIYPNIGQSWGILGILVFAGLLFSPLIKLINKTPGSEFSTLIYYLIAMGSTLGIVHIIKRKRTGNNTYDFMLSSLKIMTLVCFATIAIQTGIITPIISTIPMPDFMKVIFTWLGVQNRLSSFLLLVIAAPILEELIFRGIILDGLLKNYSPLKSIIISSLLFGISHLNPWQFISTFVLGVFSGWVYFKTKKLTLSILIHLTNNLLLFIGIYFTDNKNILNHTLIESYGGLLNLIIITTVAIIVALGCIHILRIEFNKNANKMVIT